MSGYLELILVYFVFSFGGTMIKLSRQMCGPEMISFMRFFVGSLVLLLIILGKGKKLTFRLPWKWIVLGAIFKSIHYFCENYGISKGLSYGSIIINPASTVLILLASVLLFHEKFTGKTVLAAVLCLAGVILISWKGLATVGNGSSGATLVFVIAAVGNSGFTIVQKKLLNLVDTREGMLGMFSLSALLLLFPAAGSGQVYLGFRWDAFLCLIGLGVITGVSFLMISDAFRTVPLHIAPLLQSITTVFSVVWGILIWGEPVTVYVVAGTVLSIAGILLLRNGGGKKKALTEKTGKP